MIEDYVPIPNNPTDDDIWNAIELLPGSTDFAVKQILQMMARRIAQSDFDPDRD